LPSGFSSNAGDLGSSVSRLQNEVLDETLAGCHKTGWTRLPLLRTGSGC